MFKVILILIPITLSLNAGFYEEKSKPATQNCKVICEKCGFYARQTQAYHDKLKSLNDSEDAYYNGMEHWINYIYNTAEHLYINGIEANFDSIQIEECPILTFGDYPLEVSKIDSPFIFILYEKGKKPYVIQDIVMSEDEINAYFNITNPKYYKKK